MLSIKGSAYHRLNFESYDREEHKSIQKGNR